MPSDDGTAGTEPIPMKIRFLTLLCIAPFFIGYGMGQQQPDTTANSQAKDVPARFADITRKIGIEFQYLSAHTSKKYLIETMGPGVALFDYDNDGKLDIFLVNGAPLDDPTPKGTIPKKTEAKYWNRLFHQKSDGTFEDVTQKAGLQGAGYGMGVAVGDYDNDGNEDLYVTAYGGNKLYHNNGDGTFSDVTEKAGVKGSGWSTSAAWVDLDGDGYLDLVVLRYLEWDFIDTWCGEHKEGYRAYCHPDAFNSVAPLVYHNNGNGTFTEVAGKIGMGKPGKGLGIALADYDRDGKIDLYVANDSMLEFLYHNKGDGTFEEVGLVAATAVDGDGRTFAGMGVDFADYNNDGWPDLIVSDLANQRYALYENDGTGAFNYVSQPSGIGRLTIGHSGWGVRFFDYDNDGWKDLMIAQGHDLDTIELTSPNLRYREPMLVAHNNNGRVFVDVTKESGAVFEQAWVARGLAIGDLDNDGRLDAVVTTNDGPVYVLHNETITDNHWLLLKLVGHKSNRDAIGAEVKLTTKSGSQYATVTTASSYLSSGDKRVHFGLGKETSGAIEIRWPSGIRQVLHDVSADKILQIDEPTAGTAASLAAP
jgi:enediyne biosynthesis protein E4